MRRLPAISRALPVCAILIALIMSAAAAPVLADSAGKLVKSGNNSYDRGDLDGAAEYYELRSRSPNRLWSSSTSETPNI